MDGLRRALSAPTILLALASLAAGEGGTFSFDRARNREETVLLYHLAAHVPPDLFSAAPDLDRSSSVAQLVLAHPQSWDATVLGGFLRIPSCAPLDHLRARVHSSHRPS